MMHLQSTTEFILKTSDSLALVGYDWPSTAKDGNDKGLIILLHGVAEHSKRYTDFAQVFNTEGFSVIAMDIRGHGLSEGRNVFIPNIETIFNDIDLLIDAGKQRYPNCPKILYGHSMGGNLALSYTLNRHQDVTTSCPYQGVIVTGPWIRLAGHYQPIRPIFSAIRAVCRLKPSLKVPLKFNSKRISRSSDIVDAYDSDLQIRHNATLSLVSTVGRMASILDRQSCSFTVPVLIEHGEADRITCHKASQAFATRGKNINHKLWPNCYHELHNEPNRSEFFHFTIDWIHQKILSKNVSTKDLDQ